MKFGFTIDDLRKEYPEVTDDLLDKLRTAVEEQNLPMAPDIKLAIFAHSCYFDFELTMRCIRNFYQQRAACPELFGDMDPDHEKMQRAFKTLCYGSLPVTTPEGYRVILHRLEDTLPENYIMDDAIKMLIMTTEIDLYVEGCQQGTLLLFDTKGVRLGHLMRISLNGVRKFLEYVQDAMPIRLKGIHVLNAVWFMSKILAIVRPFLRKEVYDLIHIYTGDVSEVYPVIPPKCLPKDYGGDLPSIDDLRGELLEKLHNWRELFLEEESLARSYHDKHNKSKDNRKETPKKKSIEQVNLSNGDSTDISTKSYSDI